jgi:hypothetical protein
MPASAAVRAHADDLADFVAASPSSFHAAAEVARRLEDAGFTSLAEEEGWSLVPGGRYVVVRDGAVIAWVLPRGRRAHRHPRLRRAQRLPGAEAQAEADHRSPRLAAGGASRSTAARC